MDIDFDVLVWYIPNIQRKIKKNNFNGGQKEKYEKKRKDNQIPKMKKRRRKTKKFVHHDERH